MNGVAKRFAMRSSTGKNATLMFHTNSAPELASPMPHRRRDWPRHCHIGAGTVLRVASLASFEELTREAHTCRRRESLPSQYTQPASTRLVHHSHLVDVYRCHDGTATALRFDWDGRPTRLIGPTLRAIRALRHLIVACYSSPPVGVRPWDELTNGTPAANIAYLACVLPRSADSTFYQDANSCRILSSAVGKQSTSLAAPAGRVPKWRKKRPMGQPDWMRFQKPR